jgi:predicted DNA-binding transcriptional regulator AlpA
MPTPTPADNQTSHLKAEKQAKELRDAKREYQQLKDVDEGVGFSSDKVLARYFDTTRKTIWIWSKEGTLPRPHKIGENTTRWSNSEIKSMGVSK